MALPEVSGTWDPDICYMPRRITARYASETPQATCEHAEALVLWLLEQCGTAGLMTSFGQLHLLAILPE